jgi:hypothetical protein
MVYMPLTINQFRTLKTLEHSLEKGQVDVLATGREGRWKTVPEGVVRSLYPSLGNMLEETMVSVMCQNLRCETRSGSSPGPRDPGMQSEKCENFYESLGIEN